MEVSELIATLKHGRPLCSFEVDGAIELVERLQAENAELKKNVELAVENHQICSLMDAGLIERKHRHIQDLEKENADLRKCWKCGKDDCNHRNLVAVEQVELLAVRLELSSLKAENDKLRREVNTKEVELFALQSGFGHCDDEYNKQIERLQSENARLYRVAYIARTIYNVTGNKQPCPHGNAAHYPTHAWWCDDCWEELRDALTEVEFDE